MLLKKETKKMTEGVDYDKLFVIDVDPGYFGKVTDELIQQEFEERHSDLTVVKIYNFVEEEHPEKFAIWTKYKETKMTNKQEKFLDGALKGGLIFTLALTSPIWVSILALGVFFCFPLFLIYMMVDEYEQSRKESEKEEFRQ